MGLLSRALVAATLLAVGACGDDAASGPVDAGERADARSDGGTLDGAAEDAGGGPVVPIVPGFAEGGRLEVVAVGADGSPRAFLHFHDTALDVPCDFSLAEDGVLRCLPVNRRALNAWPPAYADAACTEPLRTSGDPACAPLPWGFAEGELTDACGTAATNPVVHLEEIAVPGEHWTDESGTCTGPVSFDPVPERVLRVTGPWPPAEFVAAEERVQRIDDRLSARVWVTADGAGRVAGLVDALHGDCHPGPTPADGTRCIPASTLPTGPTAQYYLDAACTAEPAVPGRAPIDGCDRADPTLAKWHEVGEGGAVRVRVHRLGEAVSGTVYRGSDCTPVDTSELAPAIYPVGDEITSELVAFAEAPVGDGALQARFWTSDGTPVLPIWKLHDPARGTDCDPVELDGVLRCVPARHAETQIVYADAACTDPVHHDYTRSAVPLRVVLSTDGVRCDPTGIEIGSDPWLIGDAHEGSLYGLTTGSCAEMDRTEGHAYYAVTPLDPGTLPAASL